MIQNFLELIVEVRTSNQLVLIMVEHEVVHFIDEHVQKELH